MESEKKEEVCLICEQFHQILSDYSYTSFVISKMNNGMWDLNFLSSINTNLYDSETIECIKMTIANNSQTTSNSISNYINENFFWLVSVAFNYQKDSIYNLSVNLIEKPLGNVKVLYSNEIDIDIIIQEDCRDIELSFLPFDNNVIKTFIKVVKLTPGKDAFFYIFRANISEVAYGSSIVTDTKKEIEIQKLILLSSLLSCIIVPYIIYDRQKESIKSAVSAIMARNMSHNLGSHYLTNTKNYIGRRAEQDNDADLRGIHHLLQYIQERMDYIATIVSNDVYPLGALNVKSQLFDELTIDDCGKRHKKPASNFLLQYLVYSEKFTRGSTTSLLPPGYHELSLQIKYNGKIFTGTSLNKENETEIKLDLSKLQIAVPGGVMARHALFNIIENIIRNSAKHAKIETDDECGNLIITLDLTKIGAELEIKIYDNKRCAETLKPELEKKFNEIQILNKTTGELDKRNKGLKEIIISALWLKNKNIAEVLFHIDSAEVEKKMQIITENAIELIAENGHLGYKITLPIFQEVYAIQSKSEVPTIDELIGIHADLIISPKEYEFCYKVRGQEKKLSLSSIFTRTWCNNRDNLSEMEMLKRSINTNLGINIDEYSICIESDKVSSADYNENVVKLTFRNEEKNIIFKNHFYLKSVPDKFKIINEDYSKSDYIDSISGENFTTTIVSSQFLNDEVLRCKVIESALTKIAIIDERIFESCRQKKNFEDIIPYKDEWIRILEELPEKTIGSVIALIEDENSVYNILFSEDIAKLRLFIDPECGDETPISAPDIIDVLFPDEEACSIEELLMRKKNLFVYSFEFEREGLGVIDLSTRKIATIGQEINCINNFKIEPVHFMSIHLSLIEKYRDYLVGDGVKEECAIEMIMTAIRNTFGNENVKIAIHSGRGNFSEELQEDLKAYPFITLSALEAAFNNSKYLLSQLFYNTIYYGKGNINNNQTY